MTLRSNFWIGALVVAMFIAFGAFGLRDVNQASADSVTGPTSSGGSVDAATSVTITTGALDDTAPDLVVTTSLGTLALATCSGAGGDILAAGCVDSNAAGGTIALDDDGLDADTVSEAYTITATLTATCEETTAITITSTHGTASSSTVVICNEAGLTITATIDDVDRTTVEIFAVDHPRNHTHTGIRIRVEDDDGDPVDTEVVAIVNNGAIDAGPTIASAASPVTGLFGAVSTPPSRERCTLSDEFNDDGVLDDDETPLVDEAFTGADGEVTFTFCANWETGSGSEGSATPGTAVITFIAHCPPETEGSGCVDKVLFQTITVIGPPASLTLTAAPTTLVCGEKSTVTGTVRDAIGQNVSPGTDVILQTNLGGVTTFSAFPGGATGAEVNAGTFTTFLLTSDVHVGPYEVVAGVDTGTDGVPDLFAQVTVTCTVSAAPAAAPTAAAGAVSPPRTGTGITPPSTGNGGLADGSGSSLALLAGIGAAVFVLAGVATVKAARR